MSNVILYGIGNSDMGHQALRYFIMNKERMNVCGIVGAAERMCTFDHNISDVYMMDDRKGLRAEYEMSKSGIDCDEFYGTLLREGILVYEP